VVVTAGFDPLRDEGTAYAAALAGPVAVEYRCYDDMVHGFFGMGVVPDCLALATRCATPWAPSCGGRRRTARLTRPAGCGGSGRRRPLHSGHGRDPRNLALSVEGEWQEGCTFDADFLAASGGDRVLVLPTARLRAPRAPGGRAGAWFEPLGGAVEGLMVLTRADAENDGAATCAAGPPDLPGGSSPMHVRSVLKHSAVWAALVAGGTTEPSWWARRARRWP